MSFTPGTRGLGHLDGDFSGAIGPLGVDLKPGGAYYACYREEGSSADLGVFIPYNSYPLKALEEREGVVFDGDWMANRVMLFENGYPILMTADDREMLQADLKMKHHVVMCLGWSQSRQTGHLGGAVDIGFDPEEPPRADFVCCVGEQSSVPPPAYASLRPPPRPRSPLAAAVPLPANGPPPVLQVLPSSPAGG